MQIMRPRPTPESYCAAAGAQHQPLALAITNADKLYVFICPTRCELTLRAAPSILDGRTFAFEW